MPQFEKFPVLLNPDPPTNDHAFNQLYHVLEMVDRIEQADADCEADKELARHRCCDAMEQEAYEASCEPADPSAEDRKQKAVLIN